MRQFRAQSDSQACGIFERQVAQKQRLCGSFERQVAQKHRLCGIFERSVAPVREIAVFACSLNFRKLRNSLFLFFKLFEFSELER